MPTMTETCHCGFARTPSNAHLHAHCEDADVLPFRERPFAPPTPRDWPERTERIDVSRNEYVELRRFPAGTVGVTHVIGVMSRDFALLTADESARVAAFILRTQRGSAS